MADLGAGDLDVTHRVLVVHLGRLEGSCSNGGDVADTADVVDMFVARKGQDEIRVGKKLGDHLLGVLEYIFVDSFGIAAAPVVEVGMVIEDDGGFAKL